MHGPPGLKAVLLGPDLLQAATKQLQSVAPKSNRSHEVLELGIPFYTAANPAKAKMGTATASRVGKCSGSSA